MPAPRKLPSQKNPRSPKRPELGLVRAVGGAEREKPSCPDLLGGVKPLGSTVQAWDRLWSSAVVQVVDLESDMESVERWAALLDERERAFTAFRKQRLVEGSQGQAVLSPLWQVVRSCDTELRALEDRIGLSPKARLQLGITYAEAGRSLDEMNRMLEVDDADEDDAAPDPRLQVIDDNAS